MKSPMKRASFEAVVAKIPKIEAYDRLYGYKIGLASPGMKFYFANDEDQFLIVKTPDRRTYCFNGLGWSNETPWPKPFGKAWMKRATGDEQKCSKNLIQTAAEFFYNLPKAVQNAVKVSVGFCSVGISITDNAMKKKLEERGIDELRTMIHSGVFVTFHSKLDYKKRLKPIVPEVLEFVVGSPSMIKQPTKWPSPGSRSGKKYIAEAKRLMIAAAEKV